MSLRYIKSNCNCCFQAVITVSPSTPPPSNSTEPPTTPAPPTTPSGNSSSQLTNGQDMDSYLGIIESPPLHYISYSRPDSIVGYKPPFDNQPFDGSSSNSDVAGEIGILLKEDNAIFLYCISDRESAVMHYQFRSYDFISCFGIIYKIRKQNTGCTASWVTSRPSTTSPSMGRPPIQMWRVRSTVGKL